MNNNVRINSNSNNYFRIIDLIPNNLDILFSTIKIQIKIKLFTNNSKNKDIQNLNINFTLNILEKEFKKYVKFFFTEQIEKQNPRISFTYEDKKSTQLNFELSENFFEILFKIHNLKIEKEIYQEILYEIDFNISYLLRKKILNFESLENENEIGYKIPSGILLILNKIHDSPFIIRLNNHLYYNMPDIDGTMPFNIIALSWVLFGFILIQTLNLFLTKNNEESLLQSIKNRFMTKWGFLFKR